MYWRKSVFNPIGECQFSLLLENVSFQAYWKLFVLYSIGDCQFSFLLENVSCQSYWKMFVLRPIGECQFSILLEKCQVSVILETVSHMIQVTYLYTYPIIFIVDQINNFSVNPIGRKKNVTRKSRSQAAVRLHLYSTTDFSILLKNTTHNFQSQHFVFFNRA